MRKICSNLGGLGIIMCNGVVIHIYILYLYIGTYNLVILIYKG